MSRGQRSLAASLAAAVLLLALGAAADEPVHFTERAKELGIDFTYRHFGTGKKYMPENMGPGVVIFDYDGDGRLDLYVPQGAPIGPAAKPDGTTNRLYRQTAAGRFVDATEKAGVGDTGYGQGASFADYDNDGDLDLYVTNYGPNVLYRNRGDGTFENVTAEAGVGCPSWSMSSGFFDYDGDGDLDLLVVNYVDFAYDNHKFCGNAQTGLRAYCHPDVYNGLPDFLYRNEGNGRFTDVSVAAGLVQSVADKGLGVTFVDFDGNGTQDAYVANDSTMNYLYLSDGKGKLMESALLAGVGVNARGMPEASMGLEFGDLDGDGRGELFVTHLDQETVTLYRSDASGLFEDATARAGLSQPSLPWVSFGTVFFDYDNDGDLDVFVANGHIIDNIEQFDAVRSHRQPAQLFENDGAGLLTEVSERLGLGGRYVGRGAAAGDLDRDGDLDLVFGQNDDRVMVLINQRGTQSRSLAVRLAGATSNPQGFGARLELTVGERMFTRWMRSSTSYMSQGPPEVYFGLGSAERADELVVHWPSGRVDKFGPLTAGASYLLREGSPEIERTPFGP